MGATTSSPLDFKVGITEKRGAKSLDLKVHLQVTVIELQHQRAAGR